VSNKNFNKKFFLANRKPFWAKPLIVPSSPLAKTPHPKNPFEADDRKIREEIKALSAADEPVDLSELTGAQKGQVTFACDRKAVRSNGSNPTTAAFTTATLALYLA
jgi:hypothetical protein